MKIFSKYVFPPLITLFFFLLGGAFILILDIIVPIGYDYLAMKFPGMLDKPSSISDPEAYEAFRAAITSVGIIINIFIISNLSMRFDNKRFEHIIVKTEGLYKIPEMTREYVKDFWLSDVINASIAPILLTVSAYLIPSDYIGFFSIPLWCGARLIPFMSLLDALVLLIGVSIITRFIQIPAILRSWRGRWLTGDID
jgi:hypothetical protein